MGILSRTAEYDTELLIDGKAVPVRIFIERRRDCRVSIVKSGIRLRIASYLSRKERHRQVNELLVWARKKIEEQGWGHPGAPSQLPERRRHCPGRAALHGPGGAGQEGSSTCQPGTWLVALRGAL